MEGVDEIHTLITPIVSICLNNTIPRSSLQLKLINIIFHFLKLYSFLPLIDFNLSFHPSRSIITRVYGTIFTVDSKTSTTFR